MTVSMEKIKGAACQCDGDVRCEQTLTVIVSIVKDTLTGQMGCTPILCVKKDQNVTLMVCVNEV